MIRVVYLLFTLLTITNCSLNPVINHHGVHNLDLKQSKIIIGVTNKNDLIKIIGPPMIKSYIDENVLIYIEKKTSSSKLSKFGKQKLLVNDVLVLNFDNKGILINKLLLSKEEMNNIVFEEKITGMNLRKKSFIIQALQTIRTSIDDPLGKKRIKNK
jgi:outer membrane protein assembly factor BamE (lipoprotein component of BamABCDE complex)